MNFNLSQELLTVENRPMKRTTLNKEYQDLPLTLAFALAHVLSVATEDLSMLDHQAMQMAASGDPQIQAQSRDLKREAMTKKEQRGLLAQRIAEADPAAVPLTVEDCTMILEVAAPRLLPTAYAALRTVIN